jgi:flavin-dependent dehydrogenase
MIVGGGVAGCALALEALRRGCSVGLCDGHRRTPPPHLGEMADVPESGSGVSESFLRWSGRGIGVANSVAVQQIDKHAFNQELLSQAITRGARYLPDTAVLTIDRQSEHWRIETKRGVIVSALLADATGRTACVARKLGATRIAFDTLTATTIALPPRGDRQQYLIEAAEAGWWYCACHPKLGRVGTYFTDNDLRTPFADALRKSKLARPFLDDMPPLRPRVLAAGTALLQPVAGPGWFAVGDAAWSCDPLSSSGIANALRSAAWVFAGVPGYRELVANAFAEYRRAYRVMYQKCTERGEFWRRRAATS